MDNEFVCFLDKEYLKVNKTALVSMNNAIADNITFYLMLSHWSDRSVLTNPLGMTGAEVMDRLLQGEEDRISGTTYLLVIVPCGKDEDSFIDGERVKGIHFETDDWIPSEWTYMNDGDYGVVLTHQAKRLEFGYADSFRFRMYNIVSQTPPGITNFSVQLLNLEEGGDLTKTFQIYKQPAGLEIMDFSPDRHSVALGEQVMFTWMAAGHEEGTVFPGTFRIGQGSSQFNHVVEKSTEYQLCIQNKEQSASRKAPVYLAPPHIQKFLYDRNEKKIHWSCLCAQSVHYMGEEQPESGEKAYIPGCEEVTLVCRGYLMDIVKTLFMPSDYREDGVLSITILQFKNYSVMQLEWDMEDEIHISLTMGETQDLISDRNKGTFEYAGKSLQKITAVIRKKGRADWKHILQKEGVYHL